MPVILLLVVILQPSTMDQHANTMDHLSGQDMDSNQLERIRAYLGSTRRMVVDVLPAVVIVIFLEITIVPALFMGVWS